jgi:hypothetical protein
MRLLAPLLKVLSYLLFTYEDLTRQLNINSKSITRVPRRSFDPNQIKTFEQFTMKIISATFSYSLPSWLALPFLLTETTFK